MRFKRILLKLSGEAFHGSAEFGIDGPSVRKFAREIAAASKAGVQVAVVVGGGNFFRGAELEALGMDRSAADYIGMLATVMNALALQEALEAEGAVCRTQSAIEMHEVAEPYIKRRAVRHLEKGRVVTFAAGTGNPFFSTDTAGALRALEIGAEVFIKATRVDGIYDSDPEKNPKAKKIARLTYTDALDRELGILDATAFALCRENNLPIIVFNIFEENALARLLAGEEIGSFVSGGQ